MPTTDPRIDAYIAKAAEFAQPILTHARAVVHEACPQVEETVKWGMPTFQYGGRILCGMAAFKQHASFGFWQHAQVMETGERTGMGSFGKMTTVRDFPARRTLVSLIRKAMALIDAGAKPDATRTPRATKPALRVPADLRDALAANAVAKKSFDGFSPSARRDYIEWITEAKRAETRTRRLEQAIAWLAEGKTRNWKYERRG
ncbi:MAG: YdeI/OmpD-associated family protein [Pseudoxanthomonas sp.]